MGVLTDQQKNQHLLWRAGFGPATGQLNAAAASGQRAIMMSLWKASSRPATYLDVTGDTETGPAMGMVNTGTMQGKDGKLSDEEKKQQRKQSREEIKRLNLAWLNEMVNTDAQLREKMALFWHGHFASRNENILFQQLLLNTIRQGALGNFGDLLKGVSKSASMINFLNNNQNRKDHPNENFAREVMELFTMGRGNYTEQDVREAARAFTGWGANPGGEFVFRKGQHDNGQKTLLGKTGYFDGDDVLNLLLEQKQTALHITGKLYRYLVDEQIDEARVAWLADRWYQHNYDIQSLIEDIFHSDWFYDPRHYGSRIKSPVDLLVGTRRLLPMTITYEEVQLVIQRLLGQLLFYPPNVAGWPGGLDWIDSSSLMFRLSLPVLIYGAEEFQQKPRDDDDMMMGRKDPPRHQMINASIDWTAYLKRFEKIPDDKLFTAISSVVLQAKPGMSEAVLKEYTIAGNREDYIKTATIRLMSTPEYQLC
ncbi:DUF1800 domain-containing protein [Flavitalea flava]